MSDFFETNLKQRKQNSLYREIFMLKGVDFTSNDYLNLSSHLEIRKKMLKALEKDLDLSSKASRLLGGTSSWHSRAEEGFKGVYKSPGGFEFFLWLSSQPWPYSSPCTREDNFFLMN